ncbi:MAG: SMC-Scp complex subunit ScpB [bacterium]
MDTEKIKYIIEALLFVTETPITIDEIYNIIESSIEKNKIKEVLEALIKEYQERKTALQIKHVAQGYQFYTKPEYAQWISKLANIDKKDKKFSRSTLETLAIIAYKQPVIKAEIEAIRGITASSPQLKLLLEKKLIRISGKKDVPGRPLTYGTTKEFLQHFGLPNLAALPQLNDFKEFQET